MCGSLPLGFLRGFVKLAALAREARPTKAAARRGRSCMAAAAVVVKKLDHGAEDGAYIVWEGANWTEIFGVSERILCVGIRAAVYRDPPSCGCGDIKVSLTGTWALILDPW